jgi:CPA1 family monovalent cation:H+ antiporter
MNPHLIVLVVTLAVVAGITMAARRLRTPYPILLVLAGLAVALVPGIPRLPLDPDLILVFFLPPLLYADTFDTSWYDFRRWLRPIVMLAVGLVACTILTVGVVAKWCFPELPWAGCFILGAIVSPTDTVAAQAVIQRLRLPRRVTAILGGESLVNDATGLVGVQVGVAVALSGAFDLGGTALTFAWVGGLGIAAGAAAGVAFALLNRRVHDTRALFALSLLCPYAAYAAAAALAASGVLAVVVAGFIVSWRINHIPPASRVPLFNAWQLLAFLLNGFCFVFIGMEAPHLLRELDGARGWLLAGAAAVAGTVIATRALWCFPGAYLPLLLSRRLREREGGYANWRFVALTSWCGMRGVVSLAAALALPRAVAGGAPFPGRDLIVFCTMVVIAATLLVQGSTLLPLIRLLGIREDDQHANEARVAREAVLKAGIARLDAFCSEHSCPLAVHHLRQAMADQLSALQEHDIAERELASRRVAVSKEVQAAVLAVQAEELLRLRDHELINDITYVELQLELDRFSAAEE